MTALPVREASVGLIGRTVLTAIPLLLLVAAPAAAQLPTGSWGIRGGIGTDITGGIAFGGQFNYQIARTGGHLEVGPLGYFGSFEETTEEGHTYVENTDVVVFGVIANWLFGYDGGGSAAYFVVGVGLAGVGIDWEETSETDSSLGTPFGASGSRQSADGFNGGTVFNLGVGRTFGTAADVRAEIPVIVSASAPGEASSVIPTFTVTVGIRFP